MKICLLHRYPLNIVSGTNPSFLPFVKKLIDVGHQVHIVTYKNANDYPFKGAVVLNDIRIDFKRENFLEVLFKSLVFIVLAPLKVREVDKKVGFDLIYCDDSFPFYEIIIKLLTKKKVLIRRGDLMCAYTLFKFGVLGRPIFNIVFFIEKFIWRKVDGISVITERFKKLLIEFGIQPKKIHVIEDSIDFDKFKDVGVDESLRGQYAPGGEFVMMYHGTFLGIKGLDVLIKAISLVVKKIQDIKFVIIGDGEEGPIVTQLIKELHVGEYVILTGWVDYKEIQKYLAVCDAGIPIRRNTTANKVIVTTALLQYWACAKPVIAPGLEAISDIVREGENGFLFEAGNPLSLAEAIFRAYKCRQILPEMGRNGYAFAVQKFGVDLIAKKMCNFIEIES